MIKAGDKVSGRASLSISAGLLMVNYEDLGRALLGLIPKGEAPAPAMATGASWEGRKA
jgi:hypothetical protein